MKNSVTGAARCGLIERGAIDGGAERAFYLGDILWSSSSAMADFSVSVIFFASALSTLKGGIVISVTLNTMRSLASLPSA